MAAFKPSAHGQDRGDCNLRQGSSRLDKVVRDLSGSDGLLGLPSRSIWRSLSLRHPNSHPARRHTQLDRCPLIAHRDICCCRTKAVGVAADGHRRRFMSTRPITPNHSLNRHLRRSPKAHRLFWVFHPKPVAGRSSLPRDNHCPALSTMYPARFEGSHHRHHRRSACDLLPPGLGKGCSSEPIFAKFAQS